MHLRSITATGLAMTILLGACAGSDPSVDTSPPPPLATVERVDECFAEPPDDIEFSPTWDCGFVVVAEDPNDDGGKQVKLSFIRVESEADNEAAPLFILGGGPGQTLMSSSWFRLLQPGYLGDLLESRDIVLLDQRGTEFTEPALVCPEFHRLEWYRYEESLNPETALARETEILGECAAQARAAGIDLADFNSVAIAADIDAARRALGYDQIVYYGGSYGSQLGQHVMRDFPEMLAAVVLDGANSLSRRAWAEDRAIDVDYALGHLVGLCEADPACAEVYDIPALIDTGLAMFDDGPLSATWSDSESGEVLELVLFRQDFVGWIYEKMGSAVSIRTLPYTLKLIAEGGPSVVEELLASELGPEIISQRESTGGGLAALMHLAVVCSDDPVVSVDEVVIEPETSDLARELGLGMGRTYMEACRVVDVPSLPDITDEDVTVDVPTLILTGGLDAATPVYRSEIVERALPNARLVTFPEGTHVQITSVNHCAATIMLGFVEDPSAPLHDACLADATVPAILLPSEFEG